ncbi:hypothetical protein [uncultured Eubacterium sp.]|uniref:hypothetical protein n=1 Tax=uncultured Eubacterium sp. TaxID=165185 RepID=UPI0025DFF37D|nr:hypothetical protein [uncultured Eubacterium sp.]
MIIELLFVVAFITYIAIYVWSTKRTCKSNELKTCAIWQLYKELERYNDKLDENEE